MKIYIFDSYRDLVAVLNPEALMGTTGVKDPRALGEGYLSNSLNVSTRNYDIVCSYFVCGHETLINKFKFNHYIETEEGLFRTKNPYWNGGKSGELLDCIIPSNNNLGALALASTDRL